LSCSLLLLIYYCSILKTDWFGSESGGFVRVDRFWRNEFSRNELGRIHFEGFGRDPLDRTGQVHGWGDVGQERDGSAFFFSKIQK
jgi:hypothetical protein